MKKLLLKALSTLCLVSCFTALVFASQTSVWADTTAVVSMEKGAYVRLSEETPGIRFISKIDNYDPSCQYGMYIFPADYLNGYESGDMIEYAKSKLAFNKELAGGDCVVYEDCGEYYINGALVGLKYSNLNREFAAISYVKDGQTYTYSEKSDVRDIVSLSTDASSNAEDLTVEQQAILNNFIKLGKYQAVGESEDVANGATELPVVTVSGSATVYKGLWVDLEPTFTYKGNIVTDYKFTVDTVTGDTVKDDTVKSSGNKIKANIIGSYDVTFKDVEGKFTLKVIDFDEQLNSEYFGNYTNFSIDTLVVNPNENVVFENVANAENIELSFYIDNKFYKDLVKGTKFTVSGTTVTIPYNFFHKDKMEDLFVLNGDTATYYKIYYNEDYFKSDTLLTSMFRYVQSGLGRKYDDGCTYFIPTENADLDQRYFATGFDIEYLKRAYNAGYYALEFDVTVDSTFVNYANKGIRVYASNKITGTPLNDKNVVDSGAITDGTAGLKIYGDFGTNITEAGTFTVKVVLEDFLNLLSDVKQFRMVVSSDNGNKVAFSNFHVRNITEEEKYLEKYGFNEANSTRMTFGGKWEVVASGIIGGIKYDTSKKAMYLPMNNGQGSIESGYPVVYTSIDMLTEAQEKGFDAISFKVYSNDGAFTKEGNGIRVYSKAKSDRDAAVRAGIEGVNVYKDFGCAKNTTEFTVIIDIDDFMNLNKDAKYVGVALFIPTNTTAYFTDLKVEKYSDKLLSEIFGFNQQNSQSPNYGGMWSIGNTTCISAVDWDSTEKSMKVTVATEYKSPSKFPVIYTDFSILERAYTHGFNKMSFTVKSNDAFLSADFGIKVCANKVAGIGAYNLATYSIGGIYVYGDFGMEANVKEFTVTIDIADAIAKKTTYSSNYLDIAIYAPAGSVAYFSDLTFSK